jgi:hypothetical protein
MSIIVECAESSLVSSKTDNTLQKRWQHFVVLAVSREGGYPHYAWHLGSHLAI